MFRFKLEYDMSLLVCGITVQRTYCRMMPNEKRPVCEDRTPYESFVSSGLEVEEYTEFDVSVIDVQAKGRTTAEVVIVF